MDGIDVLTKAYFQKLRGNVSLDGMNAFPVYTSYQPSTETAECYIDIQEAGSTQEFVKRRLDERIVINIGIYSKSDSIDADKVADIVRSLVMNEYTDCLLVMPAGCQTWIRQYSTRKDTLNLSPDSSYINRFLTFTHRFITRN